jgi:hypothetical protein
MTVAENLEMGCYLRRDAADLYQLYVHHVPRGLARAVGAAEAGSSGQGWRG